MPYPSCSLRLFSLQIDLLDDFLQDLIFSPTSDVQTNDPLSKTFCSILNSIVYIADVIQQWRDQPVRVESREYRCFILFLLSIIKLCNTFTMNMENSVRNTEEWIRMKVILTKLELIQH